jgi:ribosomal protein L44E|tara:strand:+ start:463 stop:582 length:120 start_codon:yes stop_codon:yes gene_type:complete
MPDRIEYCSKCKDETMHVVSGSGKYKDCLECPPKGKEDE